jgi:hypothetical protein
MQVFLTWSGERSKAVAQTFSSWIRQVIQAVEPWISLEIEKGTRWNEEVVKRLEESRVGIICLTKENRNERWILFESGAIQKTKHARVCTFLLDIDPSDVEQPLGGFQHTTRDKNDVRRLLHTINNAVEKSGERALPEPVLDSVFETNWLRLSETLETIASQAWPSGAVKRTELEILQEILEIVRGQERRIAEAENEKVLREPTRKTSYSDMSASAKLEMVRRALESDTAKREMVRRALEPGADLKKLLASDPDDVIFGMVADYIPELKKKPKGSRDEEENGET